MDQVLDHERRYESPSFSALKERKNASNNEPTPSSPLPKALARSFSKVQPRKDPSGNIKLKDIGLLLRERIEAYFKEANIPIVGPAWTRCRAVESPMKDQHDLIGPTYIEVIANDPFKLHLASLRSVKHIGIGDLKLEAHHRNVVSLGISIDGFYIGIPILPKGGRGRDRESSLPTEKSTDLAYRLQFRHIGLQEDAVDT